MFPKYSCFFPLFYKTFNINDDTDGMQICKTHSEGTAEGGQHQARPVAKLQDALMKGMALPSQCHIGMGHRERKFSQFCNRGVRGALHQLMD